MRGAFHRVRTRGESPHPDPLPVRAGRGRRSRSGKFGGAEPHFSRFTSLTFFAAAFEPPLLPLRHMNGWALGRPKGANWGVHMIKILFTVAGAALLAGTVVLLSGMTPIDPATSALAYGKTDRLDVRAYGPGCSERGWPYYEATCLHAGDNAEVKRVRIVTTDRLPADVRLATSR
jgi:hypothetical protein